MLNRLKIIVAKPPTSNKKFHRNTEDVLKSLGRKQKVEEENAFSFQRHLFPPKKKKKKEKKEKKKKKKKKKQNESDEKKQKKNCFTKRGRVRGKVERDEQCAGCR